MSLLISYKSDGFPSSGSIANTAATLPVSWDKLLWAALTVGRPNRQCVFAHGSASLYEALFRLSLVRMTLEQSGRRGRVLRRTAAAKSLDPTEKGAVNYFLGMVVAKLFAAELLATPWVLHLDVFRPALDAVLRGRSRPDLVGQDTSGRWIALECKGRVSPPNEGVKSKAKGQAQRVVSIAGIAPAFAIGAVTYFRNDTLEFFWRDPEGDPVVKNPFEVVPTEGMWDHYYALVQGLMLDQTPRQNREGIVWSTVHAADVEIGVHARVWDALSGGGEAAKRAAEGLTRELGECNADGVIVRAGASWAKRFVDSAPQDET